MGTLAARLRPFTGSKSMQMLCARVIGVLTAVTLMVTGFGFGVASAADPLIGKTYSDAAGWVSQRGTPVVATVTGSQLALDDCIVVSWTKGGFLNSAGKDNRSNEYYLNLNCNNQVATPGHPGNSLMTPEGQKRKTQLDRAEFINNNPDNCRKSEEALERCRSFCESTGLCTV